MNVVASLRYYWRTHLALAAGAALGTAVLSGALLVGDSMRGSLEELTRRRLGRIDLAVSAASPFREQLAADIAGQIDDGADGLEAVVSSLLSRAAVVHAESGRRATGAQVVGVDEPLLGLFGEGTTAPPWSALLSPTAAGETAVVLSQALADELGAADGDLVLVHLPRWSDTPRSSLLGRRDAGAVVRTLRSRVVGIADRGPARLSLTAHQGAARNVLLPRPVMARLTEQQGRANTLLVAAPTLLPEVAAERLQAALATALTLDDVGLELRRGAGWIGIESRQLVLSPPLEAAVERALGSLGWPSLGVLSSLADTMRSGDREVPYSTVAAVDPNPAVAGGTLTLVDGQPAPRLGSGEALLGAWLADQLAARVGDRIDLSALVVDDEEQVTTSASSFVVAGVVGPVGLGMDASLTPAIPGVDDAKDMRDWDPPFPVDLSRVRPEDEEYWDRHHAAPKAFVSLADGQRLWASRHGRLTSVRVTPPGSPEEAEGQLATALLDEIDSAAGSLTVEAVAARGLRGAGAASQFSGLFLGFSLFLIVSACLLVALLFRFGLEQRASEVGILLAVGTRPAAVRRRFLAEGTWLALAGALAGLPLAVAYARLLLGGLTSWWSPAVGTSELSLHLSGASLAGGALAAVAITVLSLRIALRQLARLPTTDLLARRLGDAQPSTHRPRLRRWAFAAAVAAVAVSAAAVNAEENAAPLSFLAGTLALMAALAAFAAWCSGGAGAPGSFSGLPTMAAAGVSRRAGRSTLTASLVAAATFVLLTVALNRRQGEADPEAPPPGAGGFSLLAESEVPLYQPLDTADGRFELGFGDENEALLAASTIEPLRVRPGDDASCLNLYRPEKPRILGVRRSLGKADFPWHATSADEENPWELLWQDLGPGVVPAIGDAESTQWILRIGLGDELTVTDDDGRPLRLRLVATLHASIFQSELLIADDAFRRTFSRHDGHAAFLVAPPDGEVLAAATALESTLARFGVDAQPTASRLAGYQAVANTYLATFQAIGGIGLLLGTLGLSILLLRNVLERRAELAALRAMGYPGRRLALLVWLEHALLLLVGLGAGSLAAVLASAPTLLAASTQPHWPGLAATTGAIAAAGTLATAAAARSALRAPLLDALRRS